MDYDGKYFRLAILLEAPLPLLVGVLILCTVAVVASFIIQ